jgi:hypothetical protein
MCQRPDRFFAAAPALLALAPLTTVAVRAQPDSCSHESIRTVTGRADWPTVLDNYPYAATRDAVPLPQAR